MFSKELDRFLSIPDAGLSGHKVIVVGDLMLDRYLWGSVRRISPEATVPVVRLVRQTEMAGGAGNVVRNLVVLGLGVTVGGCIGDDVEGDHLLKALDMVGVDASAVVRLADRPTITKSRIVGEHQQMLRLDVERLDQTQRRVLIEQDDRVDARQPGQDLRPFALGGNGAGLALQSPNRAVAVQPDDEPVPLASGLRQEGDVADVQQVEATVREDNPRASGPPVGHPSCEGVGRADLVELLGPLLDAERFEQLLPVDRRGPNLADDDSRSEVGQAEGIIKADVGEQRCGERGNDRIAGAGDIKDLAGDRWENAESPRIEMTDPRFAEGHD